MRPSKHKSTTEVADDTGAYRFIGGVFMVICLFATRLLAL
jgi:hypothetical protein